jgi:DNA-binding NtrC family response regulator/anti-anti-sigma regulatory factor
MAEADGHSPLEVEHVHDATIVNFKERALQDDAVADTVGAQLLDLAEVTGPHRLILNFANVEQLTSLWLGKLIALHKRLRAIGGQLVLYNLIPAIREVLHSTQLNVLFILDEPTESATPLGINPPHFTRRTSGTAPEPASPSAKLGEIALYDPKPSRAAELTADLSRDLSVVHFTDIETLDRHCERTPPAAVALALPWPVSVPASGAALDSPPLQFLRARGRQFSVLAYVDTTSLPIEVYCQALAAGAKQVVNEQAPSFREDLRQLLLRLVREHEAQKREKEEITALFAQHGIYGQSAALQEVLRRALKASRFSDLPVLIQGETGTGKQRLAEAIHALDHRRQGKPLLTVNCSALTKSLAESELFGHARGAFSGAEADRLGLFRAANGGTMLLDEVGDLDLELQPKLLRVLQERRLLPVGEDYEHPLDIRIIAATNQDLERAVAEGRFRADLYQRFNVVQIRIPPLRERPEDVAVQARYFLEVYQAGSTAPVTNFGPRVLEALQMLPWEGNTRQLESLIREALAHKDRGTLLEMEDLPQWVFQTLGRAPVPGPATEFLESQVQAAWRQRLPLNKAMEEYECRLLQLALQAHRGNRTRAAAELGLTPRTIFNKIKKYHLD